MDTSSTHPTVEGKPDSTYTVTFMCLQCGYIGVMNSPETMLPEGSRCPRCSQHKQNTTTTAPGCHQKRP